MRPDRWFSIFVMQPLFRAGLMQPKPGISILMYHSVSEDPEPGISPYYRLATPPVLFRKQMRFLKDHGYVVIDLAEALRRLEGRAADLDRLVVLTFDDGYSDFMKHALPVLADFGYAATIFLPTDFVNDSRKSFKGRGCLTWAEVRELRSLGMCFGSHTASHRQLHGLKWPEVEREIADSKRILEERLGEPANSFSYPYAYPQIDLAFCKRLSAILNACGYRYGVTTRIGRIYPGDNQLALSRLPVNGDDDMTLFRIKLQGAYNWLNLGQILFQTLTHIAHKRTF